MASPSQEACAVRSGEELDSRTLADFLREQVGNFDEPLMVLQFPHGHSNLTYLLRSGNQEWVLRRPPFGNQVKTAHDMGREFHVLSGLSKVFPPAPRPLLYCDDDSVLGAPFYLMERRSGLILRRDFPAELKRDPVLLRDMCRSLVDTLADLHSIDPQGAGLAEFGKPEGYVRRQIEGWTKRYRAAQTDTIPEVDHVANWLSAEAPAESGVSIIHNDFKFDNVAFNGKSPPQVATVFDWEMATIGDPLMDLGTTLGYWVEASEIAQLSASFVGPTWLPGSLTRAELVERYAQRRGLAPFDAHYYHVYGLFKIAVIVQQIYVRFARGMTSDPRFAALNTCVLQLARLAATATTA